MTQENFDLFDSVPEVQTGFTQYGKLAVSTTLFLWRDGKREECSRADFLAAPKEQRSMDARFIVNIREFKPNLGFDYDRKVRVGSLDWLKTVAPSLDFDYDRKVRVGGLDWQKIVVPSIKALIGDASIETLNGKYVAVQDVPEIPKKNAKPDAKQYNTVKFIKVYASRDECLKDASEGFSTPSNGSVESDPNVPADYSKADWLSMKQDVVDAVNQAIAKAEAGAKGKPKPVIAKAMETAKAEAIATKAQELAATPEQVSALLTA